MQNAICLHLMPLQYERHLWHRIPTIFSHCCYAILDRGPKNVLSSPGECHFNEVDRVVMVDTENHLATLYPCHERGLLRPAVKYKQGIQAPNAPDSLPALSFTQVSFRRFFFPLWLLDE